MVARCEADVTLHFTVEFDDDQKTSLKDQAWDAIWEHDISPFDTSGGVDEVRRMSDRDGSPEGEDA